MATFSDKKDPEAVLDYLMDWGPWLKGDILNNSTWSVKPTGSIQIVTSTFSNTTSTVWLSGGTRNKKYEVINHITTTGGRQEDRTIIFTVTDR